MAQLQQRVFMIFVRPAFVKKAVQPGYPNILTKYSGKIYREPIGNEVVPIVQTYKLGASGTVTNATNGALPVGYKVAIELPNLNAAIPQDNNNPVGGGIERFNGDIKGSMPSDDEGGVQMYSTPPFNENNWFSCDPWMLHSTWTSFEDCKHYVKILIDIMGFSGILVANAINMELELLPNK